MFDDEVDDLEVPQTAFHPKVVWRGIAWYLTKDECGRRAKYYNYRLIVKAFIGGKYKAFVYKCGTTPDVKDKYIAPKGDEDGQYFTIHEAMSFCVDVVQRERQL